MLDMAANVTAYRGPRSPVERAAPFDYCFNCLHLQFGYYLASWGMRDLNR